MIEDNENNFMCKLNFHTRNVLLCDVIFCKFLFVLTSMSTIQDNYAIYIYYCFYSPSYSSDSLNNGRCFESIIMSYS